MTAPAEMTPEIFYDMTKQAQADLIWKSLFVQRSPVSEACRGIGKFPCSRCEIPLAPVRTSTHSAYDSSTKSPLLLPLASETN
jgi:hypothetical protein